MPGLNGQAVGALTPSAAARCGYTGAVPSSRAGGRVRFSISADYAQQDAGQGLGL
jgi:hypothetical protein